MYFSIRHLTKFLYSSEVSESMMETRMHPRSDQNQRCLTFHLSVSPRCRVFSYRDHLANHVHHFDIPGMHGQLVIVAESLVEVQLRDASIDKLTAFLNEMERDQRIIKVKKLNVRASADQKLNVILTVGTYQLAPKT